MPKAPATPFWQVVHTVATLFSHAYMLARTRAASHPSPIVRALTGRDHANLEVQLLEREAAILRAQRSQMSPHRRPEYTPEQRAEILQLMRLRGWSPRQAADRFVLHVNTIRSWRKAVGDDTSSRLLGEAPWQCEVERLFRALRWSRWMLNARGVQRKLNAYRTWYNHHRPHGAMGLRTPDEAGSGTDPPSPMLFRTGGDTEPIIEASREDFRGDPHMPLLHLRLVTTKLRGLSR